MNRDDEKALNYPSLIAFVATLIAAIVLFALGHRDYGALVLLGTLGIVVPQPVRADK